MGMYDVSTPHTFYRTIGGVRHLFRSNLWKSKSALRRVADWHQTIVDHIPAVVYRLSLQGGRHEVRVSQQLASLGLSVNTWKNEGWLHHQMCCADDFPSVKKALELSCRTGADFHCEYRINFAGDALRWFNDNAVVVMDKEGNPLFLQGVMTDITRIKSLEAEFAHYRSRLDKLVHERTERLERRLDILGYCNSSLGASCQKMHSMYVDLLGKLKVYEDKKKEAS